MCCNDFVFVNVVKILKKYTMTKLSDENLLNYLLSFIIDKYNLLNKLGNKIYLDKEQTSRLMTRSINFPDGLSDIVYANDIEKVIEEGLIQFVNDYINKNYTKAIISEIKKIYHEDIIISEETCSKLDSYTNNFICFLTHVYLESLKYENKRKKYIKNIWIKGQNEINYCIEDIIEDAFKENETEKIIVIPVDTSFDTIISKPEDVEQHISEHSLHGKFIKKIINNKKINLKNNIEEDIKKRKYKKDLNSCYPIGSIVIIKFNKTYFYLFAISQYNENKKTFTTKEELENSMIKLLEFYDKNGQGYPIYVPLIGTGRSRANLNHNESLNLIKKVLKNHEDMINGSINIVIYYNDLNKIERRYFNEL